MRLSENKKIRFYYFLDLHIDYIKKYFMFPRFIFQVVAIFILNIFAWGMIENMNLWEKDSHKVEKKKFTSTNDAVKFVKGMKEENK